MLVDCYTAKQLIKAEYRLTAQLLPERVNELLAHPVTNEQALHSVHHLQETVYTVEV